MTDFSLLIDGELVAGAREIEVIDPALGTPFAMCPVGDEAMLDRAVRAAARAFPGWAATAVKERIAALAAMADAIEAERESLAVLLVREQGKTIASARAEVDQACATFRNIWRYLPEERRFTDPDGRQVQLRLRPLGVVAAITPWNVSVQQFASKIAPALVTGNTIVLKPAPTTPLTSLRMAELIRGIVPPGVVNVIADDNDLGAALTGHPLVAKIGFTGSTATGKRVMASSAEGLKRVTLELGGNDAAIVLDDAPVEQTADGIFAGAFRHTGQSCVAVKRVYAQESLYDALCQALAARCERTIVGSGLDPATELGPLQNRAQYERVQGLLADVRDNARVLGGAGPLPQGGYFIRPQLVCDAAEDSRIVAEEQFGPLLPVLRYTDTEDAIARANATAYGLGGSVWSADLERAAAVAERLETGSVWINHHPGVVMHLPFAGAKQSGLGVERGEEGLREFYQEFVIATPAGTA